eukprot:8334862-Pyramimonas_sp.AAC.1
MDNMFDNNGVKKNGDGFAREELAAATKVFEDGAALKIMAEEFGVKAIADINAVIEAAGVRE